MGEERQVTWSSKKKVFQGFLFSYELSAQRISYKLFRLFPVGRIPLKNIRQIRSGSWPDILPHRRRPLKRQLRCRYWPSLQGSNTHAARYVIETHNKGRTLVRLESDFHYRLRSAVGAWHREPED